MRLREPPAAPRVSDLGAVVASTAGKIELETLGDETREEKVIEKLVQRAVRRTSSTATSPISELRRLIERFEAGVEVEVGERAVAASYTRRLVAELPELQTRGRSPRCRRVAGRRWPSAVEFVLEGLHLNRRLNKDRRGGARSWRVCAFSLQGAVASAPIEALYPLLPLGRQPAAATLRRRRLLDGDVRRHPGRGRPPARPPAPDAARDARHAGGDVPGLRRIVEQLRERRAEEL